MGAVYMHVGVYVYDQFYRGKLSAFVAVSLLVGFNPPPSLPVIFKTFSENLSQLPTLMVLKLWLLV